MLIFRHTFSSLEEASAIIAQINKAINTTYIPKGKNTYELVMDFTTTQLSRNFTPGYERVQMSMTFNEKNLEFSYISTSQTRVFIAIAFDDVMTISTVEILVDLPAERAKPRRKSYEALTNLLYSEMWLSTGDGIELIEFTKSALQKLNPQINVKFPVWTTSK